jgi:hypothetical protein
LKAIPDRACPQHPRGRLCACWHRASAAYLRHDRHRARNPPRSPGQLDSSELSRTAPLRRERSTAAQRQRAAPGRSREHDQNRRGTSRSRLGSPPETVGCTHLPADPRDLGHVNLAALIRLALAERIRSLPSETQAGQSRGAGIGGHYFLPACLRWAPRYDFSRDVGALSRANPPVDFQCLRHLGLGGRQCCHWLARSGRGRPESALGPGPRRACGPSPEPTGRCFPRATDVPHGRCRMPGPAGPRSRRSGVSWRRSCHTLATAAWLRQDRKTAKGVMAG